jgi:hypothetical protein
MRSQRKEFRRDPTSTTPTESLKYGDWCALLLGVKGNPPEKASAISAISRSHPGSRQDCCGKTPSLVLSDDLVMVYVLRDSGCVGRFTSGRVERTGSGVNFYDRGGISLNISLEQG